MRIPLLALILVIASTCAAAQSPAYCIFHGPLFYRAEENPHFKGSLQDYFETALAGHYPATDGTITTKLLIDTSGKVCCLSIDQPMPWSDTATLMNSITAMPSWTPGTQNHRVINFAAVIKLTFSATKLTVTYTNEAKLYPRGFKPPHS